MIGDLFATLVGYPSLSRTASTALSDLGESIKDNATAEEIAALLDGALTEEAFVRLAALQALQVCCRCFGLYIASRVTDSLPIL